MTRSLTLVFRAVFTFFIGTYLSALLVNGDPCFIKLLACFSLCYAPDSSVEDMQFFLPMCDNAMVMRRQYVFHTYLQLTYLLDGKHVLESFLNLPAANLKVVVSGALTIFRHSVPLLTFQQWLDFWLFTMYPLMPWSCLYSGGGIYGPAYKHYIRSATWHCILILLNFEVGAEGRHLVYDIICYVAQTFSAVI